MKKILVVCAAITLSCFLVHAQEAEDTGRGAGLSVISRLDAGVNSDKNEGTYFSFGNTSLYTLFEGNISENWSFSVANHWLGADFEGPGFKYGLLYPTGDLYANTFNLPFTGKSGNSIIDWAYASYTYDNWVLSVGKIPLAVGGFEFDEYDFDVNPATTSTLWNSFFVYQRGFSIAYTTADEAHTITAQISTNQYNNSPALAIKWNGEIGIWSTNYSVMLSDRCRPLSNNNSVSAIISIGNRLAYKYLYLTIDMINRAGDPLYNYTDIDGFTFLSTLGVKASETLDLSAKYCLESFHQLDGEDYYLDFVRPIFSIQADWHPIDNLRVQGYAGVTEGLAYAAIGATYTFDFKLW